MAYRLISIFAFSLIFGGCSSTPQFYQPKTSTLQTLQQADYAPKNLAIAFGGGGVRGFVHLGAIKALHEAGIKADLATGSSIGALVAALYASGKSYQEIEKMAFALEDADIVEFAPQTLGLLAHQDIAVWIEQQIGHSQIEHLAIPLGVSVTQLNKRQALLITEGSLGKAIQASTTVPGTFVPLASAESIWLDGGVLNNLPVRFAKALGAKHVIAIDIYCGKQQYIADNAFRILLASSRLQSCALAKPDQQLADILIQPNFEPKNPTNFSERESAIEAGYQATLALLPKIKQLLAKP